MMVVGIRRMFFVAAGTARAVEYTYALSTSLPSPKCTTSEKWIADCQKRKVAADYNGAVKKKKTESAHKLGVSKLEIHR
ncbi:hypothetical protein Tco_0854611, partial [Tanacetum coccineum]